MKEYGIKEDPRFKQARKEAKRIFYLVIIETVWVFSFAYWGTTMDASQYTFIWGIPAWYFWAFLGAGIIFPIAALVLGLLIKDCDLTDEGAVAKDDERNVG